MAKGTGQALGGGSPAGVGSVALALITAAAAALGAPEWLWIATLIIGMGLGLLALALAFQDRRLVAATFRYFGFTPRPKAVPPRIVDGPPTAGRSNLVAGMSSTAGPPMVRFVAVPFCNVAESVEPGSCASGVVATVEVFDDAGQLLDRAHGRWREVADHWAENRGLGPADAEAPARPIDLAPDGQVHLLDVVAQDGGKVPRQMLENGPERGDLCMLARDPIVGMLFKAKRLFPGRYRLDVSLRGMNLNGTVRFSYDLDVLPDPPSLDETAPPPTLTPR
jgi:hypothetical protein